MASERVRPKASPPTAAGSARAALSTGCEGKVGAPPPSVHAWPLLHSERLLLRRFGRRQERRQLEARLPAAAATVGGVQSRPELNGATVTIRRFLIDKGRYTVLTFDNRGVGFSSA